MIGQHDDRIDLERVSSSHAAKRSAECCDMIRQQPQPAFRQVDGEEEAAPGEEIATIPGHAACLRVVHRMGVAKRYRSMIVFVVMGFAKGSTHPTQLKPG